MEDCPNSAESEVTSATVLADRKSQSPSPSLPASRSTSTSVSSTPGSVPLTSPSPKKSARLAEKRKLREEAGSGENEDFYFTPYKLIKTSTSISPPTIKQDSPSKFSRNTTPSPTKSIRPSTHDMGDGLSQELQGGDSSDEEKWFDAVEPNKLELEEGGDKPPPLTARQKSLKLINSPGSPSPVSNEENISNLPHTFSTSTLDSIRVGMEKSERRRLLAQQKKEFDKKRTMDRLLKKQLTKPSKIPVRPKVGQKISECVSSLRMIIRGDGNCISFPLGFDVSVYGLPAHSAHKDSLRSPLPIRCGVEGCSRLKKYNCSKTNVPLCSLECYRKNLAGKGIELSSSQSPNPDLIPNCSLEV